MAFLVNPYRYGGSVGAFTPLDLPTLERWWDPELSDYSSGVWEDLTGTANISQATVGFRPTPNAIGLMGNKPSLAFDGVDDRLSNSLPFMNITPSLTCIVIAKGGSQIDKRLVCEGSTTSTNPVYAPVQSKNASPGTAAGAFIRNNSFTAVIDGVQGPTVFDATTNFFGTKINQSTGTLTFFKDLTDSTPINFSAPLGTVTVDRFSIGCMLRASASAFWGGELGPVLIFSSILTGSERQQVRDYYSNRGYVATL